jgi:hypothetical protein
MRRLLLSLIVFAFAVPTWAQVWDKKPMAEWSSGESRKVLEESPWAEKWTTVEPVIQQTGRTSDGFDRDSTKEMWYLAQFWSALPVRQAQVRSMQIDMKYNQKNAEEKALFDANAKQFIETPFTDAIVLRVTYGSNVAEYDRKMRAFWTGQTLALQKNLIVLVSDGKRVPLSGFQGGQRPNEFYLFFPREFEGKRLIDANSKTGLEFYHPDVANQSGSAARITQTTASSAPISNTGQTTSAQLTPGRDSVRVWVQFKPNKMLYQGQLNY